MLTRPEPTSFTSMSWMVILSRISLLGPLLVQAARSVTSKELDVHLMISNPDSHLEAFADAGADWITVHVETCIICIGQFRE